jgi:hypothetical protein
MRVIGIVVGLCLVCPFATWLSRAGFAQPGPVAGDQQVRAGDDPVHLRHPRLTESSGLARSHRREGVFWTHNDSGGGPWLFAFERSGVFLGARRLEGAWSLDWEDAASFTHGGEPWLLVADTGDNLRLRPFVSLYLLPEPKPDPPPGGPVDSPKVRHLPLSYPGGPRDCEAVAVDASSGEILLVSKVRRRQGLARVYRLPPAALNRAVEPRARDDDPPGQPPKPLVAEPIADLALWGITGMDIAADGRWAILINGKAGYLFERSADQGWAEAFAAGGLQVQLPKRRQGEAVCFGASGRRIYLTSEGQHTPLWTVELPEPHRR